MTTTTTTAGELELASQRRRVAELYATVRQTRLPLGPAGVAPPSRASGRSG
jgi:hypothetical protein